MGQIIGIISLTLILSAIYLRVDGRKNISDKLFILGIAGVLFFVVISILAIFD